MGVDIPADRQPDMPDITAMAMKMNRIAIWYIFLSTAWLITSITLLGEISQLVFTLYSHTYFHISINNQIMITKMIHSIFLIIL